MRWQDRRRRARFLRTRDLVVVSWPIAREDAERLLPRGLEPSTVDGRYLISVVAMRHEGKLRYGQINIRTYVDHAGSRPCTSSSRA